MFVQESATRLICILKGLRAHNHLDVGDIEAVKAPPLFRTLRILIVAYPEVFVPQPSIEMKKRYTYASRGGLYQRRASVS
jgi:hypothetical protein